MKDCKKKDKESSTQEINNKTDKDWMKEKRIVNEGRKQRKERCNQA